MVASEITPISDIPSNTFADKRLDICGYRPHNNRELLGFLFRGASEYSYLDAPLQHTTNPNALAALCAERSLLFETSLFWLFIPALTSSRMVYYKIPISVTKL